MPGRVLKNIFLEKAITLSPDLEKRCIANCLEVCQCRDHQDTYCIIQALDQAARGGVENGLIFAGSCWTCRIYDVCCRINWGTC
jgi:nitronate monooxygenase